jgi:hypothetical protein
MERQSACTETGLTATVIATNALVEDICVIIVGSNTNKAAPSNNQHFLLQ